MDFVALPKIELHAHLTGSIRRSTLHDIWKRKKASQATTLEDPLVVMPEGKHDFDLETFFPLFSSYIYNLLVDEESIRFATAAVLRDFLDDGVAYAELRTTPRDTPQLTAEEYVAITVDAIEAFERANPALHVRLILSVDRRHDLARASAVVDIALQHGGRVVGLDLCGDPTARTGGAVAIFTPVFERARAAGLAITLHFAEAEQSASREELDVLLSWRPQRLGHVIWEDQVARDTIRERGLCLELCLSCNVKAGMIRGGFESHHFGHWRGIEGPRISIATDDVGVFGSPLSNEYSLVAEHFGLNRAEICSLARQSIDAIFGGEEEKKRLQQIMWH